MVKWADLALPKDFGGLGFTETRLFNTALLAKWLTKIESEDKSLCVELLRKKYLLQGGVFQFSTEGVSQFWTGVLNTRKWMKFGSVWQLGNGTHFYFWLDLWVGSYPLNIAFFEIFKICNQQKVTIAEVNTKGLGIFTFRRSFVPQEVDQWRQLCDLFDNLELSNSPDIMRWALTPNKQYTTQSLYRALSFRGIRDEKMHAIWRCPAPMKIKHFLWLALRDRIQSCEQLKTKGWEGSELCVLCNSLETTRHILFSCPMATFIWCVCRDAFGWHSVPNSFEEFFSLIKHTSLKSFSTYLALLAAISWVLWTTRNDMIFRSRTVYSPLMLPFRIVSYMLQWRGLSHANEAALMEALTEKLKSAVTNVGATRAGIG